jgi:hypothetical protein
MALYTLAKYLPIDIVEERKMSLLVPVGYELVKEPVNKFLQSIVYSA